MGVWALFLIVTNLFETTKTSLLKNAHIRFVSGGKEDEKSEVASSSLIINSGISLFFILLIVLFRDQLAELLNAGKEFSDLLLWYIPGLALMVYFSHLEAIQQSHFDFKGAFAGNLIRQLSFCSIILIHVLSGSSFPFHYLSIYLSLSILLGTSVLYIYTKKYLEFRFNPSRNWIRKLTNYGGYIFGSSLISNIFSNLDQLLTSTFLQPGSVAFYNAAKRINGFIDIPTYTAADILFPKMSQASSIEGIEKVKYLFEKMVAVLLSFIIPAALFVIIFPKTIIYIIAGSKYEAAAPILQIYMVISIIGTLQHQAATTLNSIGRTKLCFMINLASLVLNLGITYLCLLYFGFYGAAVGGLITMLLTAIAWYATMKKTVGVNYLNIPVYSREFYMKLFNQGKSILNKKTRSDIAN